LKQFWFKLLTLFIMIFISIAIVGTCIVTGMELSKNTPESLSGPPAEFPFLSDDSLINDLSVSSDISSDDISQLVGAPTDASPLPDNTSSTNSDSSIDPITKEDTVRTDTYASMDIGNADIEAADYAFYTGKPTCPKPVISYHNALLTENVDYILEYSNNINPGTAFMKMQGINAYTGTITVPFEIIDVALSTRTDIYEYTGHVRKPTALLSGTPYKLKNESDYTVTYKNNRKCGNNTATLIVNGIGKWYGSISKRFSLSLKKPVLDSATSPVNQRLVVSWTPDTCVTGYQLRYEINGQKKAIKIPGGNQKSKTISQLPKDVICKVDIRSYLEQDGKTFYSSWSDPLSVQIRYRYWNVTQYESVTGKQAMIYAITDRYNRLTLIDGGHTQDANLVRSIIKSHNNCVYAWILTHPHPDHIGAFNEIMENNKNIKVNRIFATKVDSKRYHETARSYDDIATYDRFCKIARNHKNVKYLQENDTFSVWGLSFKVLHGWDSEVNKLKSHLCNNGSLMFKISGATKSMLFCSDTQSEMQDFIYPGHKNELKSDYVQCGHHGSQGLTNYFYSLVDADVAFMDAPPWLFTNNGSYDAYRLKNYLESKGTKVYRYDGKTHTVKIT